MKTLLFLFFAITFSACSQKTVNNASYHTGRAARTVVEGAKSAYHATVEGASQAYENASEGYQTAEQDADSSDKEEFEETEAPKAKYTDSSRDTY